MVNILLKNIPDESAARLSELARKNGMDRMNFIIGLINDALARAPFADKGIILGFIELKNSELDETEVDCPQCDQPLHRPHIGFDGALQIFGPVCINCAVTE